MTLLRSRNKAGAGVLCFHRQQALDSQDNQTIGFQLQYLRDQNDPYKAHLCI